MINNNIIDAPNINRGKAYEERVCLICKSDCQEYSSYCKPCFKKFKNELLKWSLQDHILKLNKVKLSNLQGKNLKVKCVDGTFSIDLLCEEDKAIYRLSPNKHNQTVVSIATHEL